MSQATRHLSTDAYGREYGSIVDEFGAIPVATEGQVHRTVLQCALGAHDLAEVREFADMCGYPL